MDMMRTVYFIFLLTIVGAQVLFPTDEIEGVDVDSITNSQLIDDLDVDNRQSFNSFSASACVIPSGETGRCLPFSSCNAYASMRRNLNRPSVLQFLRARICSRGRNFVHLCCPTSNGGSGNQPIRPPASNTNKISQQTCGSVPLGNRVVGGIVSAPGKWPWMAALGTRLGSTFSAGCAGTLITRRHVLTAGHCFVPIQTAPTMVRLGVHDLTRSTTSVPPQDFNIKDRRDGGYNPSTNENDISIVILDGEANFNSYVQPGCLPFNLKNKDFLGEELIVTGWGRTRFENLRTSNIPMEAVVPVKSTRSCASNYRKLPQNKRPVIDHRSLCAGNGTTDACTGDSGGPLHYLNFQDGKYYVVGIVSFGVGCAKPEFPGVYTRITSFLDWIERNVQ